MLELAGVYKAILLVAALVAAQTLHPSLIISDTTTCSKMAPHNQTLLLGDSLSLLRQLHTNTVDAIVTDPPYMTTDIDFDKKGFNVNEFIDLCVDKLKPNGQLVCTGSLELLACFAKTFCVRWTGVWIKDSAVMRSHSAKKPMSKSELYAVFAHPDHKIKDLVFNQILLPGEPYTITRRHKGKVRNTNDQIARINGSAFTIDGYQCVNEGTRRQTDVINAPNKPCMVHSERTIHPTQKPVKLMSTFIQWTTNEGDLVLDPFMGSGTTGVACKELKRDFIGIELNPEFYEIALNRLKDEVVKDDNQLNLFNV